MARVASLHVLVSLGVASMLWLGCVSRPARQIVSPRADASWTCRDAAGVVSERTGVEPAPIWRERGAELTAALVLPLRACLATALHEPTRASRVAIELALDDTSKVVRSCVAAGSDVDPAMVACIADAIARPVFPYPRPGTVWRTDVFPYADSPLRRSPRHRAARCVDRMGHVVPDSPPLVRLRPGGFGPSVPAARWPELVAIQPAVSACCNDALARDPHSFGLIAFVAHLGPDGRPTKVCTEGTGVDEPTRGCVEEALGAIRRAPSAADSSLAAIYAFTAKDPWPWPLVVSGAPPADPDP